MASIASPRIPASNASSRRTSLDTNRTSSPSRSGAAAGAGPGPGVAGAAPGPPARRNRAALRDYYNLRPPPAQSPARSGGGGGSSVASTDATTDDASSRVSGEYFTSQTSAPSELDRPGFDAEAHVRELLATQGLTRILAAEGRLLEEMRELDGERKALVYDNYAKLIAATDTIRDLRGGLLLPANGGGIPKSSIPGITAARLGTPGVPGAAAAGTAAPAVSVEPGELRAMVDTIARVATELAGSAATVKGSAVAAAASAKGDAATAADRKRRTVRWIVESPRRLRGYVDAGETQRARNEYEGHVGPLLERWRGTGGVGEVQEACLAVLADADANAEGGSGGEEDEDDDEEEEEEEDEGKEEKKE